MVHDFLRDGCHYACVVPLPGVINSADRAVMTFMGSSVLAWNTAHDGGRWGSQGISHGRLAGLFGDVSSTHDPKTAVDTLVSTNCSESSPAVTGRVYSSPSLVLCCGSCSSAVDMSTW